MYVRMGGDVHSDESDRKNQFKNSGKTEKEYTKVNGTSLLRTKSKKG